MQHAGAPSACPTVQTVLTGVARQVDPVKYRGTLSSIRTLIAEEGSRGILKGFGPTLVGYSLQGSFKYGLYEVFKDLYMNLAGEELSNNYKPLIWAVGSASAEVFADIALCPLEMTKVKVQTSPRGSFPTAFLPALRQMSVMRAETRYPFGSLVPLWSRQASTFLPCIIPSTKIVPPGALHDREVLHLRANSAALLYAPAHRAERLVRRIHATRRDLRLWLHRRHCLRHRLKPCRLPRLTTGQGGEQGKVRACNHLRNWAGDLGDQGVGGADIHVW